MICYIGRTSGPCTDEEAKIDFSPDEIDVVKDVLGAVNRATQNKERWYVRIEDGPIIIPTAR